MRAPAYAAPRTLTWAAMCLAAAAHAAPPAAQVEVGITGYAFTPAELHIRVGDRVTWVNREKRVSHSIVFVADGEASERFFPGERWARAFAVPGRYEYRCGPHPEMHGVVIVE